MSAAIEERWRARELGLAWLHEFDAWIELRLDEAEIRENKGQWLDYSAVAYAKARRIEFYHQGGSSKATLKIIAHEIGHIALNHCGQRPKYVQEFEAERFAAKLFARDGLKYDRQLEWRGRLYVQTWIYRGLCHGLRSVDPRIARWAKIGTDWDHGGEARVKYSAALDRRPERDYYSEAGERIRQAIGSAAR